MNCRTFSQNLRTRGKSHNSDTGDQGEGVTYVASILKTRFVQHVEITVKKKQTKNPVKLRILF